MLRRVLALSLLCLAALPVSAATATTYQVTTTADSAAGTCMPGSCTLRQAVAAVNGGAGGDLIEVPAGEYTLLFGQLPLLKNVTLQGAGAGATVVRGNGTARIVQVPAATTVVLSGLAIEGGKVLGTSASQAQGGGIHNAGTLTLQGVTVRGNTVGPADESGSLPRGGGVYNSGTLRVFDSLIAQNLATVQPFVGGIPEGAGIANLNGDVTVADSVLTGNESQTKSGGIPSGAGLSTASTSAHGSTVTLIRVQVTGNRVFVDGAGGIPEGGGIYSFASDVTIRESSVSGNRSEGGAIADGAGIVILREGDFLLERSLVSANVGESSALADGGGLFVNGEGTDSQRIVNSTVTGNRASAPSGSSGGGIDRFGSAPLEVLSSTIAGNVVSGGAAEASRGGNLFSGDSEGGAVVFRDTIVSAGSGSPASANCFGAGFQSAGHNIDSLDQCGFHGPGDRPNTDPLLLPLAANGGPTATLALSAGSPAIDAGDAACPATDQRGVTRPPGACDIGAFEYVPPPPPPPPDSSARLRFLGRTVRIDPRTGKGMARVKCVNAAAGRCVVALKLIGRAGKRGKRHAGSRAQRRKARRVKLGIASGSVPGGQKGRLRFKLNRRGLARLLARGARPLQVRAAGSSANAAGDEVSIRQSLKLKTKKQKRRRR